MRLWTLVERTRRREQVLVGSSRVHHLIDVLHLECVRAVLEPLHLGNRHRCLSLELERNGLRSPLPGSIQMPLGTGGTVEDQLMFHKASESILPLSLILQ